MKLAHVITAMLCVFSLSAATLEEKLKQHIDELRADIPAIGLISEIDYDGLTVRNFRFDTNEKYTIINPGEKVSATLEYEVDADKIKDHHLHHFIYGLYPYGPIGCLVHSVGIKDSKGEMKISFNAPTEPGLYQLRICHSPKGIICSKARQEWDKGDNPPNNTIIGLVYVE